MPVLLWRTFAARVCSCCSNPSGNFASAASSKRSSSDGICSVACGGSGSSGRSASGSGSGVGSGSASSGNFAALGIRHRRSAQAMSLSSTARRPASAAAPQATWIAASEARGESMPKVRLKVAMATRCASVSSISFKCVRARSI